MNRFWWDADAEDEYGYGYRGRASEDGRGDGRGDGHGYGHGPWINNYSKPGNGFGDGFGYGNGGGQQAEIKRDSPPAGINLDRGYANLIAVAAMDAAALAGHQIIFLSETY